jgi:hypothetical protein
MMSGNLPIDSTKQFTKAERQSLTALRLRYSEDGGLFTARELAYLRFARWLRHGHRHPAPQVVRHSTDTFDERDIGGTEPCAA